jgi:hypothetical protein
MRCCQHHGLWHGARIRAFRLVADRKIVFSYPGQGYCFTKRVKSQDFPLMQGLFWSITVAVLADQLAGRHRLRLLDPRRVDELLH